MPIKKAATKVRIKQSELPYKIVSTVFCIINTPVHSQEYRWLYSSVAELLSLPTVVSDWKSTNYYGSYGHFCGQRSLPWPSNYLAGTFIMQNTVFIRNKVSISFPYIILLSSNLYGIHFVFAVREGLCLRLARLSLTENIGASSIPGRIKIMINRKLQSPKGVSYIWSFPLHSIIKWEIISSSEGKYSDTP